MIRSPLAALLVALPLAANAAEYMEKTPFQLSRALSPGVITEGGRTVWVAGQTSSSSNRVDAAGQDGDPVPALLSVPDRRISERFDRIRGKGLIGAFQLLEADDVRRELLGPALQHMEARVDSVDVVARDPEPALFRHRR